MKKHEDKATGTPASKTVEINVSLPTFSSLRRIKRATVLSKVQHGYQTAKKKPLLIGGIACALFVIGYGLYGNSGLVPGRLDATGATHGLQPGTPNYDTLVPTGKDINAMGGWVRVSPANTNPVYAYVDQIGTASISVSQQPLPAEFKKDTASEIEKFAKSYLATEKLKVGDLPVYVGSSAEGPQSVIFAKDNLLILIKSSVRIEPKQWEAYITSLK